MPGAYIPPQTRRTQAVRSVSGAPAQSRRRLWWLPLLGLVPVLLIGIAAASGFFGRPRSAPVASAPTSAAPTVRVGAAAALVATATATALSAQPTLAATTVATPARPTSTAVAAAPTATAARTATTATTATAATSGGAAPPPSETTSVAATTPYLAYRVQSGDTLRFIARMYGVSSASIAQASGLQDPDRIRVGQVLTIPSQPGWLYRVQPGETLDQIAARSGVATQTLASASGLTAASVAPGQVLLIPDASAVTQQSK